MNWQWIYIFLYLLAAVWIIFAVGSHLFRNGAPFLKTLYPEKDLDRFINRMLLTGYYLLNLGFAVYNLVQNENLENWTDLIRLWAENIGLLCLILGSIHYSNLIVLYAISNSSLSSQNPQS
tara:strand:+ start:1486 stop:1848 length:363 start_codon:yes stop_codon:yes gene_type:complete